MTSMHIVLNSMYILRHTKTDGEVLCYDFVDLREESEEITNVVENKNIDDDSDSDSIDGHDCNFKTDSVIELLQKKKLLGKYRVVTVGWAAYGEGVIYVLPDGRAIEHGCYGHVQIPRILLKVDNFPRLAEDIDHEASMHMSWPEDMIKMLDVRHLVSTAPLNDHVRDRMKEGKKTSRGNLLVSYRHYSASNVCLELNNSPSGKYDEYAGYAGSFRIADENNYVTTDFIVVEMINACRWASDYFSGVSEIYKVVAPTRSGTVKVYILSRPGILLGNSDIRKFLCEDNFYAYRNLHGNAKLITHFDDEERAKFEEQNKYGEH